MTSNASPVASAHTALREATAAFLHGRNAQRDRDTLDERAYKTLAADTAEAMDALAALLRTAGAEIIPTSAASHEFDAVLHQVAYTAALARRAAGVTEPTTLTRTQRADD